MLDKIKVWIYNHSSEVELLTLVVLFVIGLYVIVITG